jgi:metallo-beta-lactamase class B
MWRRKNRGTTPVAKTTAATAVAENAGGNTASATRRFMRTALGLLLAAVVVPAQEANETAKAHIAAAKAAAGEDFQNLFEFQCYGPGPGGPRAAAGTGAQRGQGGGQRQPGPPDRSTWYAEPVKVFDNLYFFGQSEYAVWAITTSEGIVVLDTIFDYSVEEEVAGGMKKLGLDPANIKYAIVSHAHPDHDGGAKFLQDHYGTRVIMSPADWDVLDKRTNGTKPKRDLEATDGQKLTLGDTTLMLYITPGHTPGTISTLFTVKDNGALHIAALWGAWGSIATRNPFGPTSGRRSDSAASSGRPERISFLPTIPIGTAPRSICRCWPKARPAIGIPTSSAI